MHAILARRGALCAASQVRAMPLIVEGDLTPETIEAARRAQAGRLDAGWRRRGGRRQGAGRRQGGGALAALPPDHRADRGVERRPTSKNYVLYDADHNLLAVEHMLFNPTIVLVDTTVIASAPAAFRAGLGDAVSKKFEAERRRHGGSNMYGGKPPLAAQLLAEGCLRILLEDGAQALQRPAPAGPRRPSSARGRGHDPAERAGL